MHEMIATPIPTQVPVPIPDSGVGVDVAVGIGVTVGVRFGVGDLSPEIYFSVPIGWSRSWGR